MNINFFEGNIKNKHYSNTDFSNTDFTNKNFIHSTFTDCSFNNSDFSNSKFNHITFIRCDLKESNFTGCKLSNIFFGNCELKFTKFNIAYLVGVDFKSSNMYKTDFEGYTTMERCNFNYADLTGVTGLLDTFKYIKENFEIIEDENNNFLGFYGYTNENNLFGVDFINKMKGVTDYKNYIVNGVIQKNVDYSRTNKYSYGIKLIPKVNKKYSSLFKVRVCGADLMYVVVPFNVDKIRVGRCQVGVLNE